MPSLSLSPAKLELTANPGVPTTRLITVRNNGQEALTLKVSLEDIGPSEADTEGAQLLGEKTGPYSLKNFITPASWELTLEPGEIGALPITIELPEGALPGGHYGAVVLSTAGDAGASTRVISQLASLIFVRVPGEVQEKGELTDFGWDSNSSFYLTFANTGNIYLNPYGVIGVTYRFWRPRKVINTEEFTVSVDPWYVLPGDTRTRETKLSPGIPPRLKYGYYQAELSLNRGYQDLVDTRTITFWILPPWWVLALAGLLLLGFLFGLSRKPWQRGKI